MDGLPARIVQAGVTVEPFASTLVNVSARHIGSSFGPLEEVRLRVNVDNIFDRDYLGTITTTTNTAATFRPGPPRTVQVTLSAQL